MLFSINEIIDAIIISLALGFIFERFLRQFKQGLVSYSFFDFESFKLAILITAPAIILHELGHKFIALLFGFQAVFHAAYFWLGIGVLLKLLNFPFIFFVPAFVAIQGIGTPLQFSLIAFAGPAVNLVLWLVSLIIIKNKLIKKKRYYPILYLTKQINMLLFILNMLPIPGFDGFQVYYGLFKTLF